MRISDFMTEPSKGILGVLPRPWFSYRQFRREEAKRKYRATKKAMREQRRGMP